MKLSKSLFFIFLLIIISCDVDPELTDAYGGDVAWSNEENLELYLNSFYPAIGGNYYSGAIGDDAYSDILKWNGPTDNTNLFVFGSTEIRPESNPLGNWDYDRIATCNEFLEDAGNVGYQNLNKETVNRAKSEVYWFRALAYFEMAKRHGASIILYDELPEDGEFHGRADPEETWDFIAKDLDSASRYLPKTVPESKQGKLTKGAAYGLKARAMLYAERWEEAVEAVDSLEALGLYELYPDYEELFNMRRSEGVVNKESILEFGFDSPELEYSFDYFYAPPGDGGYAEISPTEDLVSEYQMKDGSEFDWSNPEMANDPYKDREERFYASILYNGANWKGREIEAFVGGVDGIAQGSSTTSTGYYLKKLLDGSVKTQDEGFDDIELTYYFMRYAEILLIYAEANAHLGDMDAALEALNKVRRRAGLEEDLDARGFDEIFKMIRHERMIELAFEGHRFWDLRRWGLANEKLNDYHVSGMKITENIDGSLDYEKIDADYGNTRVYPEKYDRFPIPLSEIERNPEMEQFPEWK